jgi:hypothetical protein
MELRSSDIVAPIRLTKCVAFINDITQQNPLFGYIYKCSSDKILTKIKVDLNKNASQIRKITHIDTQIYYVLLDKPSLYDLMMEFSFNIVYDDIYKQEIYNLILNEELQRTTDEKLVIVLDKLVNFLRYACCKNYYDDFLKNLIDRLIKYSESSGKKIFTVFIEKLNEYDIKYKYLTRILKRQIGEKRFNKISTLSLVEFCI